MKRRSRQVVVVDTLVVAVARHALWQPRMRLEGGARGKLAAAGLVSRQQGTAARPARGTWESRRRTVVLEGSIEYCALAGSDSALAGSEQRAAMAQRAAVPRRRWSLF